MNTATINSKLKSMGMPRKSNIDVPELIANDAVPESRVMG
jgi:hypothetical protein